MTFLTAMLGAVIAIQAAADSSGARALPDSAGSLSAEEAIVRGRELIGDADYDRSIEVLRGALAKPGLVLRRPAGTTIAFSENPPLPKPPSTPAKSKTKRA